MPVFFSVHARPDRSAGCDVFAARMASSCAGSRSPSGVAVAVAARRRRRRSPWARAWRRGLDRGREGRLGLGGACVAVSVGVAVGAAAGRLRRRLRGRLASAVCVGACVGAVVAVAVGVGGRQACAVAAWDRPAGAGDAEHGREEGGAHEGGGEDPAGHVPLGVGTGGGRLEPGGGVQTRSGYISLRV